MRPLFMKFTQGNSPIWVNMNQVCYISPNGDKAGGSILTFGGVTPEGYSTYAVVNESPDEIGSRSEWANV